MSKCVVHMMKMKMGDVGGIQSHNQREHKSKNNPDIDYEKSKQNIDLVNDGCLNYQRAIKERISELDLKKSIRKDAVVMCSFIVSSDKGFFWQLADKEHTKRQGAIRESVLYGIDEPTPLEYMPEDYQEDCFREGATAFFESARDFFAERYGEENLINATIHFDEHTPHLHLGIVPVTSEGKLSAKSIFTPLELKQLQTDFAEQVGAKFDLERGEEGSQNKHLNEIEYKTKIRQEKLDNLEERVRTLESREYQLENKCKDLKKEAQSLSESVSTLQTDISTLNAQKSRMEQIIGQLEDYYKRLKEKLSEFLAKGNSVGFKLDEAQRAIKGERALKYIEDKGLSADFERHIPSRTLSKNKDKER